jgi:hypothetical protein
VLIRLGVVVAVVLALIIALPFIQARRLSTQLMVDVAALRAREIQRVAREEHPLYDNGFECLRAVRPASVDDLAPFRLFSKGVNLRPWLLDEAPIDTLPAETREQLAVVGPLAEALRACSSSRVLRVVDGFAPWDDQFSADVLSPLIRATALEVRLDLVADAPERAASRCESAYAVLFDQTHRNLIGAMLSVSLGDQLRQPCAAALARLSADARRVHAATWSRLAPRIVSAPELFETERLNMAATCFLPLTNEPQLSRESQWEFVDGDDALPLVALRHYVALSAWAGWDARMRRLVLGDLTSTRKVSSLVLSLMPDSADFDVADYSPFLTRIDGFQHRFSLLPWIAEGAVGAPPYGARVDGGVEWPTTDGGVEFLPISAP